jgi:hypothetical protein
VKSGLCIKLFKRVYLYKDWILWCGIKMEHAIANASLMRIFCLAACLMVAACSGPENEASMKSTTVMMQELETALPKQTPAQQVVDLLDSKGIEHSDYVASEQKINAIIRGKQGSKLVSRSIRIDFTFNNDAKLEAIAVNEAFTGP